MHRRFVLHRRTVVLLGIFLVFTLSNADQILPVGAENINTIAENSALGPDYLRYYAEPGASMIQVMDSRLTIVRTFNVRDKNGNPLPVYAIHFNRGSNQLVVTTSVEKVADTYEVNPETGSATYLGTTNRERDSQRATPGQVGSRDLPRDQRPSRSIDAPGDELRTINVPVAPNNLGVSIAVDCDGNLYYTNESDDGNPPNTLYKIDAFGALISSVLTVDGAGASVELDEISWDEGRHVLWGGAGFDIYTCDPTTGLCEYQFSGTGDISLTDGIAFDPTDGTIWHTTDVSDAIQHYSFTGLLLGAVTPLDAFGSPDGLISGVCVGTNNSLYVGHNGDGRISRVDKTTGAWISDFATPGGRDEGLECDPVNFAPALALWSRDAYDGTITAIEVEDGTCVCEAPPPPGDCCLDIVFAVDTTGSMSDAIDNVRLELPNIIAAANAASGGDVRFGLVTYGDQVRVVHSLTYDQAAVSASIAGLTAAGGNLEPEASDEALREIITHDGLCTMGAGFTSVFRDECESPDVDVVRLIILITDARPGGCDDAYTAGVDDVNAHARGLDAAAGNILITPIYVPTFFMYDATIEAIMTDYAVTTGGSYFRVNEDGSGTGEAIIDIIENCGTPDDECGGPRCNTSVSMVGYTCDEASILDATIRKSSSGRLVVNWSPSPEANFYRLFWGYELDSPFNWTPMGSPTYDTHYSFSPFLGEEGQAVFVYVRALPAAALLLGQDVGCWPMDEGAGVITVDLAQGNDGEIFGAEWITGPSGNAGLRFGYGDYVNLQNDFQFYGQPLQVEACVTIPEYPIIQTGSYYIFSCHRYAGWFEGFGLRIDVGGRMLCEVWDTSINNWRTLWAQNLPEFLVPLNEPFLVTAVIKGPESMILVNGDVVAIGNQPYNSITNGFNMTIGAHNYNQDRYQYHMRGDIHWLKVSELE